MSYSKIQLLDMAVEIVKSYAGGDAKMNLDVVLEDVYKKLVELNESIDED